MFKWSKRQYVIDQMPSEIAEKISNYFELIAGGKIPIDLFNNPFIQRCSKFRIKNLHRGAPKQIYEHLIHTERIIPIVIDSGEEHRQNLPGNLEQFDFIQKILIITENIFRNYQEKGYTDYHPSHDEILTAILLHHEGALSIEVPVWTRKKSCLEQFVVSDNPNEGFDCDFSQSLTGHIDLLLWDSSSQCIIVADYKPEGYFLRSLPQVAIYGLILQKNLNLPRILCLSFNKDSAWLYSPHILFEDINPILSQYGNPKLSWRNIARKFEAFYNRNNVEKKK